VAREETRELLKRTKSERAKDRDLLRTYGRRSRGLMLFPRAIRHVTGRLNENRQTPYDELAPPPPRNRLAPIKKPKSYHPPEFGKA
jgi:hypothetical protein